MQRKNMWKEYTEDQQKELEELSVRYKECLDIGKTERECVKLGKKMAEKALKSNKAVRLNPMPPRERKIIHEVVNKYQELDTYSEGRDPKRYIVIKRKK